MVQCLTRDQGRRVRYSQASMRCGPWARHIYPSLVLVLPRKTCPYITKRLLMGRKESNQTNKQNTIESIAIYRIKWLNWLENRIVISIVHINCMAAQNFNRNSVDPDQLASDEANWSGSTPFSMQPQYLAIKVDFCLFDLILCVPSTIF